MSYLGLVSNHIYCQVFNDQRLSWFISPYASLVLILGRVSLGNLVTQCPYSNGLISLNQSWIVVVGLKSLSNSGIGFLVIFDDAHCLTANS